MNYARYSDKTVKWGMTSTLAEGALFRSFRFSHWKCPVRILKFFIFRMDPRRPSLCSTISVRTRWIQLLWLYSLNSTVRQLFNNITWCSLCPYRATCTLYCKWWKCSVWNIYRYLKWVFPFKTHKRGSFYSRFVVACQGGRNMWFLVNSLNHFQFILI